MQSGICFRISKGKLEQIVKKKLTHFHGTKNLEREMAFCLLDASLRLSVVSAGGRPPRRGRDGNTRLLPHSLHALRALWGRQRWTSAVSGIRLVFEAVSSGGVKVSPAIRKVTAVPFSRSPISCAAYRRFSVERGF